MEQKTEMSAVERLRQWISTSVTLKLLGIGMIILLLLIPLSYMNDLVKERSWRKDEAVQEVSKKWGDPQLVQAVVLSIPYTFDQEQPVFSDDGKIVRYKQVEVKGYMNYYPEYSRLEASAQSQLRKRGIFEVPVYESDIKMNGHWILEDLKSGFPQEMKEVLWSESKATIIVSDLSSLSDQVIIKLNGESFECNPIRTNQGNAGLEALCDLKAFTEGEELIFNSTLDFKGTKSLSFAPLAKTTEVSMVSDWEHPTFMGSTLPTNRKLDGPGFSAEWKVLHLNRPLAQQFMGSGADGGAGQHAFGVGFYLPADNYQRTERSAKYALLLITLTFSLFFFVQIIKKIRIHPMQYILVGISLVVFYTLLLSLSEHLVFHQAYLIAAGATTALNTAYVQASLRKWGVSLLTGITLSVLYVYIYSTLRMEDYALLAGSVGIFCAVGLIMYATRNINWYALKPKEGN